MSREVSRWSQLVEVDGRWTVVTIELQALGLRALDTIEGAIGG